MFEETENTSEDIPAIDPEIILAAWGLEKSIDQIAREMRLEIKTVMRILKEKQKSIVQKGR